MTQWGGSMVVLMDNDVFLTAPFSVRAFLKVYIYVYVYHAQDKPTLQHVSSSSYDTHVSSSSQGYGMAGIAQDKPTPCLPPPYSHDTYHGGNAHLHIYNGWHSASAAPCQVCVYVCVCVCVRARAFVCVFVTKKLLTGYQAW